MNPAVPTGENGGRKEKREEEGLFPFSAGGVSDNVREDSRGRMDVPSAAVRNGDSANRHF